MCSILGCTLLHHWHANRVVGNTSNGSRDTGSTTGIGRQGLAWARRAAATGINGRGTLRETGSGFTSKWNPQVELRTPRNITRSGLSLK
jgi:hypothetical protein